jgi:ElaB/YqjD/DUF883 family membrane-anchored ribosome-binding protein
MNRPGKDPSTAEIRADIARTRERMGETVEALGAQLNPSLLKQRVKDSVREATIGRVQDMASNTKNKVVNSGRGLVNVVRENPIPAAMIAGGLGWIIFGRRAGARQEVRTVADLEADVDLYEYESASVGGQASIARGDGASAQAGSRERSAKERITSSAQNVARSVGDKAQDLASGVGNTARAGGERVADTFEENPLVLGALAAAAGLAVGFAFPSTQRESQIMGSKRDELVDTVREKASEAKDRVQSAVERTKSEVKSTIGEVARDEFGSQSAQGSTGTTF